MSEAFCAAVDWGTTSFRLWLLDRDGRSLAVRRSTEGMTHCAPDRFGSVLEAHLEALDAPADLPVVVCGMAGARQGWREAPYAEAPAVLDDILSGAVVPPDARRDVRILPGVCQCGVEGDDVMRGEETQLLGLSAGGRADVSACLPGTHSKWVSVSGGAVRRFRTFMTGELFAAIGAHTILSFSLAGAKPDPESSEFSAAVKRMMGEPESLTGALFSIRAGMLLGSSEPAAAASTLSGLLIGAEMAAAREAGFLSVRPTLVSSGALAESYRAAFAIAGIGFDEADAEEAVLAGLRRAAFELFAAPRTNPT